MTRIFQDVGTVLFQVDPDSHFAFETPLLAAIVKGTRFRSLTTACTIPSSSRAGSSVDANQRKRGHATCRRGNAVSIARNEPNRLLTERPAADVSTTGGGGATTKTPARWQTRSSDLQRLRASPTAPRCCAEFPILGPAKCFVKLLLAISLRA